ncbi:hypothetical protein ACFQZ2_04755 [Streptomonospora algeriensis]|uniref:Uncharacterized protein n=1 Tax=Streptomonospora algeriensis TaxID=995084 RepID=A0ABW3BDS8_9ACTN
MNRPVIPAPQKTTRRTRSAARRKSTAPAPAAPRPREAVEAVETTVEAMEAVEAVTSGRPLLNWVLVTDDNGRTHPEARWA